MGRFARFPPLVPYGALSASYFAHVGFFNPYLTLWLQSLGLSLLAISLLASLQSLTRVFAPYAWGALSDRTGERVRLLRLSAAVAMLCSVGLWFTEQPLWLGLVLLLLFTHTSSMMSLTEASMAHLVAGDWGRYGRVRLWGSAGFMLTVLVAGVWFEKFGIGHFPGWTVATLLLVLATTLWLPDTREPPARGQASHEPVTPVLRQPAVRWFFAALLFHVMSHFAIYAFLSLYLDARGYSKTMIGLLWGVSVLVENMWFFWQGRLMGRLSLARWLILCGAAMTLRMVLTAGAADWLAALVVAQMLHALTFATHHTTCIALVTHHFPGRLRGRGQALFTVTGYGVGGVTGVLAGGVLATHWGFEAMFVGAALLATLGTLCSWQVQRCERVVPV